MAKSRGLILAATLCGGVKAASSLNGNERIRQPAQRRRANSISSSSTVKRHRVPNGPRSSGVGQRRLSEQLDNEPQIILDTLPEEDNFQWVEHAAPVADIDKVPWDAKADNPIPIEKEMDVDSDNGGGLSMSMKMDSFAWASTPDDAVRIDKTPWGAKADNPIPIIDSSMSFQHTIQQELLESEEESDTTEDDGNTVDDFKWINVPDMMSMPGGGSIEDDRELGGGEKTTSTTAATAAIWDTNDFTWVNSDDPTDEEPASASQPSKKPSVSPTTLQPTSASPSKRPSASPSQGPSSSPLHSPSKEPSAPPSSPSTEWPTLYPTESPSLKPSKSPVTDNPTSSPSASPSTKAPTGAPTLKPATLEPSGSPSLKPSKAPVTDSPTMSPSAHPSVSDWPTSHPSDAPTTAAPSKSPSKRPSGSPSVKPSKSPSKEPSASPSSSEPTTSPSSSPSSTPSKTPTSEPVTSEPTTSMPTSKPTRPPFSRSPTSEPSKRPSVSPSEGPSDSPSKRPSASPTTVEPSASPSSKPSQSPVTDNPTSKPTVSPNQQPTDKPVTPGPSSSPSKNPVTSEPSSSPSKSPVTSEPTSKPSVSPSQQPTDKPVTSEPSQKPTDKPVTPGPSSSPSKSPVTPEPTGAPTLKPSKSPSMFPTETPSFSPTSSPSTTEPTASPSAGPTTARPSASPSHKPTNKPSYAPVLIDVLPDMSLPMDQVVPDIITSSPTSNPTAPPTTSAFSASASVTIDGVSSIMDSSTSDILINVTKTFLESRFTEVLEISSVTLLSQSVSQGEEDRNLRRRGLESSSLNVQLELEGKVLDWSALESASTERTADPIGESISSIITNSLTVNHDEFTNELASSSSFFPASSIVSSEAVAVESKGEGTDPNLIMIVSGAAAALVILVGSMFYMERRSSGNKRRREMDRNPDDDMEAHGVYDLQYLDEEGEEESPAELVDRAISSSARAISSSAHTNKRQRGATPVEKARMGKCLIDNADSNETDEAPKPVEISALDMSPIELKAAIKKKESNIYVFTDDNRQSTMSSGNAKDEQEDYPTEIKHSVSSLSNPSQIEQMDHAYNSPSPHGGYLSDSHFNYTNVEKMIGDQYDTRAIMTPFTPKGNGNITPSRRPGYSFSSPSSNRSRGHSSRKDKLFDVYAPPGPLGIIIDTTPEGPMIHSLKPTSQLLGLVNAGDLIVGLDGVDTRNMTAATFTRLMAKRSQGERKITLLKGLSPLTPTAGGGTPR